MEYEGEPHPYDNEPRGYDDRDRSRSPRNGTSDIRTRSASPGRRDGMGGGGLAPPSAPPDEDEEEARNPGTNLFVTGVHPRLTEEDLARLFEKYGEVERCNIMRDPHTKDPRGFGFVNMVSAEQADAAREGLQGEVHEGRTLSIERARRARPRTPTPGKYFGPPKNDFRGPPRGGRFGDRYDDRRGYGRRDDYHGGYGYRGSRYGGGRSDDRYERSYGGRRGDRYDDRPPIDRYASREERYAGRRGGGEYYDRDYRRGPPASFPAEPAPTRDYAAGRQFDRPDDRYAGGR